VSVIGFVIISIVVLAVIVVVGAGLAALVFFLTRDKKGGEVDQD
jgi:hypothetical protein